MEDQKCYVTIKNEGLQEQIDRTFMSLKIKIIGVRDVKTQIHVHDIFMDQINLDLP